MVSAIFRTCKIDADCDLSWHLFGGPSLFTGDQRCRHRRAPDGRREDARDARQRHVCNRRLPPRGRPDGSRHVPDPDQDPGGIDGSLGRGENPQDGPWRRCVPAPGTERMPPGQTKGMTGMADPGAAEQLSQMDHEQAIALEKLAIAPVNAPPSPGFTA